MKTFLIGLLLAGGLWGQTQQFSATVTNTANTAVTWSLGAGAGSSNTNLGTISETGLYIAPASIAAQQTVIVTAKSVADPTKSGTAIVTLVPPVLVTVTPASVTLVVPRP